MEEKEVIEKEYVPAADQSVTTAASSSISSTTQEYTGTGDNNNDYLHNKQQSERKRNNEKDDNPQDVDVDEDDDSLYEHVGLLFEGSYPTTLKHFSWKVGGSDSETTTSSKTLRPIHVAVNCIDEDPGAVQSGHYLWPAALPLCDYLLSIYDGSKQKGLPEIKSVLELGAGTALTSLFALQLFHDTLEFLVSTDRDPGVLERARDNYETTMMELYDQADSEEGQESVINEIASILVEFIPLEWGQPKQFEYLEQLLKSDHNFLKTDPPIVFDLVLGSDLIYCVEVVEPLLRTAKEAIKTTTPALKNDESMVETGSRFLLSQSFIYDADIEEEIDRACKQLHLKRSVLVDELSSDNGVRIQEFVHLTPSYESPKD
jgi:predicted nicotinamide N-methyase